MSFLQSNQYSTGNIKDLLRNIGDTRNASRKNLNESIRSAGTGISDALQSYGAKKENARQFDETQQLQRDLPGIKTAEEKDYQEWFEKMGHGETRRQHEKDIAKISGQNAIALENYKNTHSSTEEEFNAKNIFVDVYSFLGGALYTEDYDENIGPMGDFTWDWTEENITQLKANFKEAISNYTPEQQKTIMAYFDMKMDQKRTELGEEAQKGGGIIKSLFGPREEPKKLTSEEKQEALDAVKKAEEDFRDIMGTMSRNPLSNKNLKNP